MVAEEYLTFFEFTGMTLDQSLRYSFASFTDSAAISVYFWEHNLSTAWPFAVSKWMSLEWTTFSQL